MPRRRPAASRARAGGAIPHVPGLRALAAAAALLAAAEVARAAPNPRPQPCVARDECPHDGTASGDGRVDPGEDVILEIPVRNQGDATATNVRVHVTARDPEATVLVPMSTYGDIPAGETWVPDPPIRVSIDRAAACGRNLVFDVVVAYDGGVRPTTCTIAIPADCFGCGPYPCDPAHLSPWSAGPYGTDLHQTAADFTIPTLDGNASLQALWSGCDSHVFVIRYASNGYSDALWNSPVRPLLVDGPKNVHYWFLSASRDSAVAMSDAQGMQARVTAAINSLPLGERAQWQGRFHAVTTGAYDLGNWISSMLSARGVTAFAIDPFQRIRQVGLLYAVGGPSSPELAFLNHETRHYNFEKERERRLAASSHVDVTLWEAALQPFGGGVAVEVDLPDAAIMRTFDTMLIDLSFECTDPWNTLSCEWDYLAHLNVCDVDDPVRCTELGRWITAYGQGGRWVTDATPLMALLRDGGRRRFTFSTPYTYVSTLKLRFTNRGTGLRPHEARFLWGGGGYDMSYNPNHAPIDADILPVARKVEIAALISGHGWGVAAANCAEFCNHEHHFTINGTEFRRSHPEAGTQWGCVDQIEIGTNPNQYGTWPYGRGGWCPGLDVAPFRADVTAALLPGTNRIEYRSTYQGTDYQPEVTAGYWGNIVMSSYLVQYVAMTETACADGVDEDVDGLADCLDPDCPPSPTCDSDADGAPDDVDCAPADPTASGPPVDPLRLDVARAGADAVVTWPGVTALGPGTVVDVASGSIGELWTTRSLAGATCLAMDSTSLVDTRPVTRSSDGWWYALRATNACGSTTFEQPTLAAFTGCD